MPSRSVDIPELAEEERAEPGQRGDAVRAGGVERGQLVCEVGELDMQRPRADDARRTTATASAEEIFTVADAIR